MFLYLSFIYLFIYKFDNHCFSIYLQVLTLGNCGWPVEVLANYGGRLLLNYIDVKNLSKATGNESSNESSHFSINSNSEKNTSPKSGTDGASSAHCFRSWEISAKKPFWVFCTSDRLRNLGWISSNPSYQLVDGQKFFAKFRFICVLKFCSMLYKFNKLLL